MPGQRYVSTVAYPLKGSRSQHYAGLPPGADADGPDLREPMPAARILVIEVTAEGVFLERYTERGEFAGDTWHESETKAKAQADFEYRGAVAAWRTVPPDVDDVVAFLLHEKDR